MPLPKILEENLGTIFDKPEIDIYKQVIEVLSQYAYLHEGSRTNPHDAWRNEKSWFEFPSIPGCVIDVFRNTSHGYGSFNFRLKYSESANPQDVEEVRGLIKRFLIDKK